MQNVHAYDNVLWLDLLYTGFNLGTEPKSDSNLTKSKCMGLFAHYALTQDRFWPQNRLTFDNLYLLNEHTYDYVLWLDLLCTGFNLGTEPKADSD